MSTPVWQVFALVDGGLIGLSVSIVDDGGGHFHVNLPVPASTTAGNSYQIVIYDSANDVIGVSGFFSITPYPPIIITTASPLPQGVNGVAYSQQIVATGGIATRVFSLAPGSNPLPTGTTISTTGLITGTISASGTFTPTIFCTDGVGPGTSKQFTIVVPSVGTLVITNATPLPTATQGISYTSVQLNVAGGSGPFTFTVTAPPLPTGVTLSGTGLFAINTATAAAQTLTFEANVTNGVDTAGHKTFTVVINPAATLVITNATPLPSATQGVAYPSQQFAVSGGSGPFAFTTTLPLPSGISLSGTGLFAIDTNVAIPASVTFEANVTNGVQTAGHKTFQVTINPVVVALPGTQVHTLADGCIITVAPGANANITNGFTGAAFVTVSRTVDLSVGSINAPGGCVLGFNVRMAQLANGTIVYERRNRGFRASYGPLANTFNNVGEPVYWQSEVGNMPGRTILFADRYGYTQAGDTWTLVRPSDPKHPNCAEETNFHAQYAQSRNFHMTDGGERFYVEYVPIADQNQTSLLPGATEITNALALLHPNEARITAWAFLEHMLNLHRHDPATFSNPGVNPALARLTWLARVENINATHPTGITQLVPNPFLKWYGGMFLFAPVDSQYPRPFVNRTLLWMFLYFLRHTTDIDTLIWAREFIIKKIVTAQNACDATTIYKGKWPHEGNTALSAVGPYPLQVCKTGQNPTAFYWSTFHKSFSEELVIAALLFPTHTLIQDALTRCIDLHVTASIATWNIIADNGNLRPAGNYMAAMWCFYRYAQITGNAALEAQVQTKAEAVIETMFTAITNAPGVNKPLWPPAQASAAANPLTSGGGFLRALEYWQLPFTKFIANPASTLPGARLPYWKLMMVWWFTNCTTLSSILSWNGGGLRRVCAYGVKPNGTGGSATWNGTPTEVDYNSAGTTDPNNGNGMFGSWVGGMEPYMTSWYPGAVAPTGITWFTFFQQILRYDYEYTRADGGHLLPATCGIMVSGNASAFNYPSWPGKILPEGCVAALDL